LQDEEEDESTKIFSKIYRKF